MLSDPVVSRVLFGGMLAAAMMLTWLSRDEAMQKAGAWLLVDWTLANLAYEALSAQFAPWATPTISALICVPLGGLAIQHRSFPVWSIIGLMVASLAVSVMAFLGHWQGGFSYYFALNVLFILRAVALGGSAGVVALAHRPDKRDGIAGAGARG